jgi:hypothetical protein
MLQLLQSRELHTEQAMSGGRQTNVAGVLMIESASVEIMDLGMGRLSLVSHSCSRHWRSCNLLDEIVEVKAVREGHLPSRFELAAFFFVTWPAARKMKMAGNPFEDSETEQDVCD